MGKKLVIKGADFSENGLVYQETLYIDNYTVMKNKASTEPNRANGGWAFGQPSIPSDKLTNKIINFVRFRAKTAGTLNFYRCASAKSGSKTLVTTIEIESAQVNTEITHIFPEITLGEEFFVIGEADSTQGICGYVASQSGREPWIGKVQNSSPSSYSNGGLVIDIGYVNYQ